MSETPTRIEDYTPKHERTGGPIAKGIAFIYVAFIAFGLLLMLQQLAIWLVNHPRFTIPAMVGIVNGLWLMKVLKNE